MIITTGHAMESGDRVVIWFAPNHKLLCGCRSREFRKTWIFKILCKWLWPLRFIDVDHYRFGLITDEVVE